MQFEYYLCICFYKKVIVLENIRQEGVRSLKDKKEDKLKSWLDIFLNEKYYLKVG